MTITIHQGGITAGNIVMSTISATRISVTGNIMVNNTFTANNTVSWRACWKKGKRRETKVDYEHKGLAVYRLTEGDWFVRGDATLDEIKDALSYDEYLQDIAPIDVDWEVEVDGFYSGYWRFVPCSPKSCGEHSWHLVPAKKGRGAFLGYHVTAALPIEVEFDYDDKELDVA